VPIRPENKHLYPPNWESLRARVLARADNKCELCGLQNHIFGFRDHAGNFYELTPDELDDYKYNDVTHGFDEWGVEQKIFMVVLTVAHLDHDPTHNKLRNLKALCQKCHNTHDAKHRAANRKKRINQKAGQGNLL
jgi:hypothetical protein